MANNIRKSAAAVVQLVKLAEKKGVAIKPVYGFELDRFCHSGHHQGVAVEVSAYPYVQVTYMLAAPEGRKRPSLVIGRAHV